MCVHVVRGAVRPAADINYNDRRARFGRLAANDGIFFVRIFGFGLLALYIGKCLRCRCVQD